MGARRGTENPLFDATIIEEGWGSVEKNSIAIYARPIYTIEFQGNEYRGFLILGFPFFFVRKRIKDFSTPSLKRKSYKFKSILVNVE